MRTKEARLVLLVLGLALLCRAAAALAGWGEDLWSQETLWLRRPVGNLHGSPLFCLLLRAFGLFSRNAAWLRLLPFLFSLAAAAMLPPLASRAFKGKGFWETLLLAAVSPLLCFAAWEVHPLSLEIFAALLWLHAFLRLLEDRRPRIVLLNAAAAAVAVAANPLLLLLVPAQAAVVLFFADGRKETILKWFSGLATGGLFAALFLLSAAGGVPSSESTMPCAQPSEGLSGYEEGYLFTDIALGRLYPWAPVTPALTFAPPEYVAPSLGARAVGSPGEGTVKWLLQGMQLLFLGFFAAAALLALLSVFNVRVRSLPGHLKGAAGSCRSGEGERDPGRAGAVLLLLSAVLPAVYGLAGASGFEGPFPERRLLFVAPCVLLLAGRGLACLEWRAGRWALLALVAIISLGYGAFSSSLREVSAGIAGAARTVKEEWRKGDALAAESFLDGALAWYSGHEAGEGPAPGKESAAASQRLWIVRLEPSEKNEGVLSFLESNRLLEMRGPGAESFRRRFPDCREEERRFGMIGVSLLAGDGRAPADRGTSRER